jgi:hypothetical protein
MTAKVNLKEGKKMPLGSWCSDNYFFQAIWLLFARVIDIRPDIVVYCVRWALGYLVL